MRFEPLIVIFVSFYLLATGIASAVSVNAQVQRGDSILITGIGGGVALIALQLCVAKGASVYVTSGSDEKIQKAMKLGAKAGVNYKKGRVYSI